MASSLVVLKFDTPDGADQGLELARLLQKEHLLQLLHAATVTWPKNRRKPKTRHFGDLTAAGACDGAYGLPPAARESRFETFGRAENNDYNARCLSPSAH